MNATQITPRMVLTRLAALAEHDGQIADPHAHWKLAPVMGLDDQRMWSIVYKLKRLGYLADRRVNGVGPVRMFITNKPAS